VQTAMTALQKDKLVEKQNDRYCLTPNGNRAAKEEEKRRNLKDQSDANLADGKSAADH
jgi:Mn-dependent DtxR family transcriptional regulator